MLRMELPEHRQCIRQAHRGDDMMRLREHVPRLHDAASICRLTLLKRACQSLAEALSKGERHAIGGGIKRLLTEIPKQLGDRRRPSSPLSV